MEFDEIADYLLDGDISISRINEIINQSFNNHYSFEIERFDFIDVHLEVFSFKNLSINKVIHHVMEFDEIAD
jgi:hypothetical protein